jgi:hypothetical protein
MHDDAWLIYINEYMNIINVSYDNAWSIYMNIINVSYDNAWSIYINEYMNIINVSYDNAWSMYMNIINVSYDNAWSIYINEYKSEHFYMKFIFAYLTAGTQMEADTRVSVAGTRPRIPSCDWDCAM